MCCEAFLFLILSIWSSIGLLYLDDHFFSLGLRNFLIWSLLKIFFMPLLLFFFCAHNLKIRSFHDLSSTFCSYFFLNLFTVDLYWAIQFLSLSSISDTVCHVLVLSMRVSLSFYLAYWVFKLSLISTLVSFSNPYLHFHSLDWFLQ